MWQGLLGKPTKKNTLGEGGKSTKTWEEKDGGEDSRQRNMPEVGEEDLELISGNKAKHVLTLMPL